MSHCNIYDARVLLLQYSHDGTSWMLNIHDNRLGQLIIFPFQSCLLFLIQIEYSKYR